MTKAIILSALVASSTAVLAQPSTSEETQKVGPLTNPDEVVCIREQPIGSRLGARRVCRTRAEWAEHRRQYRLAIDRAQQQMQTSGQ